MQTKQLSNSELYITPIGFGAWAIGGSGWSDGWGSQDDTESIDAIHLIVAKRLKSRACPAERCINDGTTTPLPRRMATRPCIALR